jgi:hypothetical protein
MPTLSKPTLIKTPMFYGPSSERPISRPAIHGVGLGGLDLVQMKNKFAQLRQKPGVSIGEFKREFDLQYEGLLGAAVPATELAMLFVDKLDPQRYAGMLAHLTNDATLGRPFPLTLYAAWSIASG